MTIHPLSSRNLVLFVLLIYLFSLVVPHVGSVSFNFNFSDTNTGTKNITFKGDAFYNKDLISLTKDSRGTNIQNSTGQATYNQPVFLWDENTGEVTNFTTQFSFLINPTSTSTGDGMAFFLSQYPPQIPPNSNIYGKYLGLFNSTTAMNASMNQIIAVEFDTFLNTIDPNSTGSTPCHIGIDIKTINSTSYRFIENCLFVGSIMTAQVEYNSKLKLLSLLLWNNTNPETNFSLNATVDIKNILPSTCAVGFSAATGGSVELHQIFSWSFNSTLAMKQNPSSSPPAKDKNTISVPTIIGIVACTFVMLSLVGIFICYSRRKRLITSTGEIEVIGDESIDYEFEKGRGPRRFPYSDLSDATNDFSENNKLGEGGFGSVYGGVLKDENVNVAVKRVSKESKQGKKEYISVVKIISQLRHRNLVQLIGWCHDHGEFLLVYELMHNGSLDKHLYNKEYPLAWPIRHNIALGLGSALLYLHEEWQQCVVHRDVKPSNIMLDSSFNAKLGDFGLARLTNHDQDLETTIVAGTKGYMAPECALGTANPSTQSDMFSLGIVLLEITCGRRPIVPQHDQKKVSLVEWVWGLYGKNALVEAVDSRLNGDFNRDEAECFMVVGLWCAHPEKSLRPSIKQAMSVLQFQAPLPILPPKMPVPIYAIPADPHMQLYTSSDATSSSVAAASIKSAPAIPSDSSWLLKQQANTF
ncbi:L-type lectin-domain containing receptor kinase IX.1 [Rhynchospora pubera]|uniref:non-specific serine/threonine protein kinase n=1 Tax=Rhynchospora pubera TaxID=906938 RepID=A0AAV8EB08_9POAL|nr:L-type lectin-domain containing receptor kinase IX.1 [Rhynchospora pubera]